MRFGDCRKDEEAMILNPAPRDGTGIKGVSRDLVSKVDSGATYRVVSGSGYAEMPAKDNNMQEENGAAFHVYVLRCVSLLVLFYQKKDGLLASHGNVQAKVMGHNLLGCVSSSTEDGREAAHIGNVLGVRSSAPCNVIDHAIDFGGVANDVEYGHRLSYVIRDGYGLPAPTVVGEHADQPARSPFGDIPRSINSGLDGTAQIIMNRETMIENLRTGPGSRSTTVDLDGVVRSPVRKVFPPLVVRSEHTIYGNIGSQPIVGSGKGKEMDVTPWKKKIWW
ncbi:hypothetical protein AMTRI_Chr06g173520 [Amborella trichopoda]